MIADKFLGAVGLVQMHLIEHESNLVRFVICLMPHSHQSLNMFKSCLVKHSLIFFSS